MPTKTIARPAAARRQVQLEWEHDGLRLPGLAEALEVYRRIAEVGGVQQRPNGPDAEGDAGQHRAGGW
jgi:hypothetical protein